MKPSIPVCGLFTIVLVAGLGTAAGCRREKPADPVPAPIVEGDRVILPASTMQSSSVQIEAAKSHPASTSRLTGRLVWDEDATVRVFSPISGRVREADAKVGDSVKAGDVLARIDSPDFGQAQGDLRKAVADLKLAERTLSRVCELADHGAAARKDIEAAEGAQANAQSEKERAEARLRLYGGQADTVDNLFALRAPISGMVVERNLNLGQEVRSDQMLANTPQLAAPLFTISDPTRLWLLVDAPEQDLALLRAGQPIHFRTRTYGDREFLGKMDVIGASLDPSTRTVKVRGSVRNADGALKAEMYVEVDVTGPAEPGVDVPAKAVFMKDQQPFVFVENSPGDYRRVPVEVGGEGNDRVLVRQGLAAGQRVVGSGSLLLQAILEAGSKGN